MNNHGIKLNMDMSYMSFMQGTAKSISGGLDEDYVTKIDMVLSVREYG